MSFLYCDILLRFNFKNFLDNFNFLNFILLTFRIKVIFFLKNYEMERFLRKRKK